MSTYSIYPEALDGYAQLPLVVDTITPVDAKSVNRLRSAIVNLEQTLGITPQGSYQDVVTRLDDIGDTSAITSHLSDITNPHEVSFSSLIGGTLSGLNDLISDATLDDLSASRTPTAHAGSHISSGSDEIDADKLKIDFVPSNYTRSTAPLIVDSLTDLSAHLSGIDIAISSIVKSIVTVITSPHAAGIGETHLLTDLTIPGAVIINLPKGSLHATKVLIVKDKKGDASVNPVRINAALGETIDGFNFAVLGGSRSSVTLVFAGTEWSIV